MTIGGYGGLTEVEVTAIDDRLTVPSCLENLSQLPLDFGRYHAMGGPIQPGK